MRTLALVLLACLLLIAPTTTAQSGVTACTKQCNPKGEDLNGPTIKRGDEPVKVVLYAHFEDILQNAPVNTQLPDATRESDLNRGFPMPVIDVNTGTPADVHFKNNQFRLFGSPGLIEYGDGAWRIHQEPGLAADLVFSEPEILLYWYMSAHVVPSQSGGAQAASVMPQVAVYARIETGRHPFHGDVIAESDDFDKTNPPSDQRVNMVSVPGQPDVYEFVVKLKVKDIKKLPEKAEANGFTVYINPYQIKTDQKDGIQVAQADWRLRTGPKFLPRLVIGAERVMETKSATMNLFDNKLYVRWSFVSMLGSYDMRDNQIDLRSTGPTTMDAKVIDHKILKKSIDHDGHFKPVNSTWEIDYFQNPLKDGDYELTASIPNLQETYLLEQKFTFSVKDGLPIGMPSVGKNYAPGGAVAGPEGVEKPSGTSPGIEASLVVLLILGVVAQARRRRP